MVQDIRTPTENYDLGKHVAGANGCAADMNLNWDKIDAALTASDPRRAANLYPRVIEYRIPGVAERPVDGAGGKVHLELQVVEDGQSWDTPLINLSTATAQTGWDYCDGADFAAFPAAGLLAYREWLAPGEEGNPNPCAVAGIFTEVPFGAVGARARYKITASLEASKLYRYRIRQISVLTSEASDWDVGSFRT